MTRCEICGAPLIAKCDRTKKSVLVEFMGTGWTKTKPQVMWLYPPAEERPTLCFYHQQKKEWVVEKQQKKGK